MNIQFLSKKHEHELQDVMLSRFGKVSQCRTCTQFFTTMLDYSSNQLVTIPGNFISVLASPMLICVVCGSQEELEEFASIIKTYLPDVVIDHVQRLTDEKQLSHLMPYQPVFVFGNWQDSDIAQSPEFTKRMNGWY